MITASFNNDFGRTTPINFRKIIVEQMEEIAPHRNSALFSEFLTTGYAQVTLSTVPPKAFDDLLEAKLCLGTIITLFDDFADRPSQFDPVLLDGLYRLSFEDFACVPIAQPHHTPIIRFAQLLFERISTILRSQPHYRRFAGILQFDLQQFYSANHFSSLVTANPQLNNSLENRLYCHHNMGMVMVAMMDLMASKSINFDELGAMREVFVIGQRMGRIFNVLSTRKREARDNDTTGELSSYRDQVGEETRIYALREEILRLRRRASEFIRRVETFSVDKYLAGLTQLEHLHQRLEGMI